MKKVFFLFLLVENFAKFFSGNNINLMEEVLSAYQVICSKLKKYTEIYKFVQVFNSDVSHLFGRKMFCGHIYSSTRKDQNLVLIKTDELCLCLQHIFMECLCTRYCAGQSGYSGERDRFSPRSQGIYVLGEEAEKINQSKTKNKTRKQTHK